MKKLVLISLLMAFMCALNAQIGDAKTISYDVATMDSATTSSEWLGRNANFSYSVTVITRGLTGTKNMQVNIKGCIESKDGDSTWCKPLTKSDGTAIFPVTFSNDTVDSWGGTYSPFTSIETEVLKGDLTGGTVIVQYEKRKIK